MIVPLDIHTHRLPERPGTAIVSCTPETFVPEAGHLYSVGIHPRYLPAKPDEEAMLRTLHRQLTHRQVLALGEAGLDKLAEAPMSAQIDLFTRQAMLAEALHKPLIIHLVRATDELLAVRKQLHPTASPWILHGFRGKPQQAEQLLRAGCYLSFGEHYHEEALSLVPDDRLFLETDESSVPLPALYERAAAVRATPPERLRERVTANVLRLFLGGVYQ
ncbi:MAG: TatD family hydrolase [Prevotellaceae bacterium]|jgi:TatD DNase family protein|nr:TatD family hydrolase [Prevotellaceae bacterium]